MHREQKSIAGLIFNLLVGVRVEGEIKSALVDMHCSKFYRFIGVATRHTESVRKWDRTPISLSHAKAVTLDESHLIQAQTPARADLRSVQTSRALIPAHIFVCIGCVGIQRFSSVIGTAAPHKASLLINFSPNKAYRRDQSVISSLSSLRSFGLGARHHPNRCQAMARGARGVRFFL